MKPLGQAFGPDPGRQQKACSRCQHCHFVLLPVKLRGLNVSSSKGQFQEVLVLPRSSSPLGKVQRQPEAARPPLPLPASFTVCRLFTHQVGL